MFDFAWSEIALIGVVALVAIGPKDMPVAIKTISDLVKKGRRMAGEFQVHVDEMVREANLHEVRDQFKDLRSLNIRDQIVRAVDGDGSLRRTMAEDPLRPAAPPASRPGPGLAADATGAERVGTDLPAMDLPGPDHDRPDHSIGLPRPSAAPAPSFLPPGTEAPHPALVARAEAPSFIPPGAAMPRILHGDVAAPSAAAPSVAGVAPPGPPAPHA